ncbi:MAG TPA: hypothetical protein VJO32_13415, partial [Ktedonobacteraceae bacterium]|nr:hypothetical protein [Ktedonobacteraceae bacterium]
MTIDDATLLCESNHLNYLLRSTYFYRKLRKYSTTVGVIEVKGISNPEGALERYEAAKKSFEESRRDNAHVKTILVASCITSEVQTRIQQDSTISFYFNLTQILSDPALSSQFMQQVFSLLEA